MSISSRFVVRSTIALLVVGFLALIGIVGTTIWLAERAQIYFNEVIEARDARGSAVELRNAVQTAESSQRGFLLTGNEIYLAPYDLAKTMAQRQLEALKRALAPYREAELPLQRLTALVGEKFAEMDQTIALKRERRDAEALAVTRTNRGKALMDEANVFFSGVIRSADDRLTTGVGEQNANATWLRWVSIIGGIVIIMVVGGATITVVRYTREVAAARDEVGILNTSLERRVRERTADLARANEEIQRFAHLVTHDLRAPLVNVMGFTGELEDRHRNPAGLDREVRCARHPRRSGRAGGPCRRNDGPPGGDRLHPVLDPEDGNPHRRHPEAVARGTARAAARAGRSRQAPPVLRRGRPPPAHGGARRDRVRPSGAGHPHGPAGAGAGPEQSPGQRRQVPRQGPAASDRRPGDRAPRRPGRHRGGRQRPRHRRHGPGARVRALPPAGAQDQPGEGIGLAYVRAIARNLGGDITVTSALGAGTTFRVVLPRHVEGLRAAAA
jgi:CHASE3 domain sensor protein